MSKDIWHKKTEQPKKLLHCTRLIITKWGSVYSEKDIDNGAFIETEWTYLDDLLALETELERTRKALDVAKDKLDTVRQYHRGTAVIRPDDIAAYCDRAIEQITALEKSELENLEMLVNNVFK